MNKLDLVADPHDIKAEWLTSVLRANDFDARVNAFTVDRIGTGQMARCFRYTMDIEGAPDAPTSLIGKFCSGDPVTVQKAVGPGLYAIEVGFYRDLASQLPISTPRCFFADIDKDQRYFTLILEDMSPAIQGDQMKGCSVEVAQRAIDELAALHATSWNDATLEGHRWLKSLIDLEHRLLGLVQKHSPEFVRRLGSQLDSEALQLIKQMNAGYENLISVQAKQPRALVHGDYRADNLLINEKQQPLRIVAVDWQTVTLGPPLQDVAYFIGASLTVDDRRTHEAALLKSYHEQLLVRGVTEFSWQQCQTSYQLGSFAGLSMAIRATSSAEETERGNKLFTTMAQRHSQHILDLNAQTLLM